MITLILAPPYQDSTAITTNCPRLAHSLHLKYGKYITLSKRTTNAIHTIEALKVEQNYIINNNSTSFNTSTPFQDIEDILYAQKKFAPNVLALHGAAIAHNDRSILFLAATNSGKTTLTSYLVSKGFRYITDDCILLNKATFSVSPYTTPLHLRHGSLDVLRKYDVLPEKLQFLDEPSFTRYIYTPTNCSIRSLPIERIFFLTRTESITDRNYLEKMSTIDRMTELLKAPITEYPMNSEHLQFIAKLAKFPCHRLFYSDMNYVQEVIRNG